MITQLHPRIAKRMPCSVRIAGKRHSGLVLNVSQGGMFVQTNASSPAGEEIALSLSPPDGGTTIPVQARVVWRRIVPQQLRTSAQGGIGVQIKHADEAYFQLLAGWMRIADSDRAAPERADAPTAVPPPSFGVRLLEVGGSRTRRIDVVADAPDQAEREALRVVGDGWRVIEITPIRCPESS